MELMQVIELVAATIGILYVWLELKASVWLWPVGIVLPLFYIYISWQSEVYGNVLVNIYYIIACIWGWREWLKHRKDGETKELPISHLPKRHLWTLALVLLLVLGLCPIFRHYMGSPFPTSDAIATAISFYGMWLLGKKYIESWYCWISSNAIFCTLYFLQSYMITGLFFTLYTVISVVGYFNWLKLLKLQEDADRPQ